MKIFTFTLVAIILSSFSLLKNPNKNMNNSIYDIAITSLEGKTINLNDFKGKKILFVNVASKCGYTSQYKNLQKLHDTHGDKLAIIGVPCNQFGGQEPGSASEIKEFCSKNYGVTFLMAEKCDVKGSNQHKLYKWLTMKSENGVEDSTVGWNFQKYLIDENGKLIQVFKSGVGPMDASITSLL
jgi:glutathione peroxidase